MRLQEYFTKVAVQRVALAILVVFSFLGIGAGVYTAYSYLWGAEAHWRAAQAAVKRFDFVTADRELARCLAAQPNKAEAHLLAAQVARRAMMPRLDDDSNDADDSGPAEATPTVGSYEKAKEHLQEYKRLGGMPELVKMEQLLTHAQRGDLAEVEEQLRAWVNKDHPESDLILEAMAKGYLINYRLANAEQCLDELLRREASPQALYLRAWMACRGQNYDRAMDLYRELIQVDPTNEAAEFQLGNLLRLSSKPREALGYFEHLHQLRPGDHAVALELAETQLALNNTAEARRILAPLLAEDPDNADALLVRAKIAAKEKHWDEAEADVRKVLGKRVWDRQANKLLAECLGRNNNRPELETKRELETVRSRLDCLQLEVLQLDQVTKAIVNKPKDATLRWEAGALMICSGEVKSGIGWLKGALDIDPQHKRAAALMTAYYHNGAKPGSALYLTVHDQLADYYSKFPEPRFKNMADYHRQAGREVQQGGSSTARPTVSGAAFAGPASLILQGAGTQALAPASCPMAPVTQMLVAAEVAELSSFALTARR
jgi:tetratricopeptide (TPR) repeat protein